jgi:hypothetical protein
MLPLHLNAHELLAFALKDMLKPLWDKECRHRFCAEFRSSRPQFPQGEPGIRVIKRD